MSATHVSLALREWAERTPARCAVRTFGPRASTLTFAALEQRVNAMAHAFAELGLVHGARVAVFVPPGPEFVALFHALLRTGAVPVLIDPGMGRAALLDCVARAAPRALIGVTRAQLARRLFPRAFASVEVAVSVGRGPRFGALALERLLAPRAAGEIAAPVAGATAAVLFTSGSTGAAKGVLYSHANFAAQLATLRTLYKLEPGAVDCACFPLFALFDHALGLTSVFPALDPAHPGASDPAAIVHALEESGASFSFGSPAIWRRVVPWMQARRTRFLSLRCVTIAGAPVSPALVHALRELLPAGGEVHTPYGATEALPVSNISGAELASVRARVEGGEGSCVGRLAPGVELALIRVSDEPIERWDESLRVAPGEAGEVCVRGAVVTGGYLADERATRAARITYGDTTWHRMGDIGRLDSDGRLWFLGRKSHRLETEHGVLYPVPLENAFDTTPGVARSALVGVGPRGRERAVLVVETLERERVLTPRLHARAGELAEAGALTGFLFRKRFPLDVRHNAKIKREELKRWAERELGA